MRAKTWLLLGAFGAFYTLVGHASLELATVHPQASVIWPASGLAIAAIVLAGLRCAPVILVGATIYNYLASGDVTSSAAISVGNTLEAVVGGLLVRRFAGGAAAFETGLGALSFCVFAGAIAPLVSATIGVTALVASGLAAPDATTAIWLTWFLGNANGALTIGALVLVTAGWKRFPPRIPEAIALWSLAALVCTVVFLAPGARNELYLVAVVPLVAWASVRLGPVETALTLFVIGVLSVTGTLIGRGPFAGPAPASGLALLQGFQFLTASVALPVAGMTLTGRRAPLDAPGVSSRFEPTLVGVLTFGPLIAATLLVVRLTQADPDAARGESIVPWIVLAVGGLASLVITALNVTAAATGRRARTLAEEMTARLAVREREFRALVEGAPDALIIVDPAGDIRIANQQAARLFGYDEAGLVGQPIEVLIPERYRRAHPELRTGYFEAPRPRPMGLAQTLWAAHSSGREIPVEISLAPIQTDTGPLVAASVRDVTVQRQSHRRLARTRDELERSNRELEEFAYIASHDLQAPLRHVAGYADLLQNHRATLDDDARHHLERIQAGVARMQHMIQDLLAYSRAGRSPGEPRPVSLASLVTDIAEPLAGDLQAADGHIVSNGLPTVHGDPAQLRQVFENLIENSLKYRGDRPPVIIVSAEDGGDTWEITVRDHGPGFDPLYKERVFQMFQRLPESQAVPGNGIGLAICRKVIEAHGGRIWAEPEPGIGCTFRLSLPKAPLAPETK